MRNAVPVLRNDLNGVKMFMTEKILNFNLNNLEWPTDLQEILQVLKQDSNTAAVWVADEILLD